MKELSVILVIAATTMLGWGCTFFHEIKAVPPSEYKFPVGENSITYIGHATVLIHLDTLNIIGDYHPRLWFIPGFMKMTRDRHMAPGDIPNAIEMLQAKMVIPIHWGTFKISGTDLYEPAERLKEVIRDKMLDGKVFILNHGETKIF